MSGLEKLSRRDFLHRTGVASGGLVFAMTLGIPRGAAGAGASNVAPNLYVNIRDDDVVEIYCHRSEMGQGIRTSLPQVIADELEADWDRIEILQALGDAKYGDQNTDGSTSIRKHFDLLRTAGASAREMLIAAAAMEWGVPATQLVARNHAVHHEASGRSAAYGDLVASAAELDVPEDVTFKDPADYRYIGKPMDLVDGIAMTTGTGMYGTDTVLPGMLYASIERCPVYGGTVKSVDDAKALQVAGVEQVIQMPDGTSPPGYNPLGGVAVLANNTWSAEQGRKALAVEWETGLNAEYDSESYRQKLVDTSHKDGKTVMNRGDVSAAFETADRVIEADYYAPHLSHAPMEPPAAAAMMHEDGTGHGCDPARYRQGAGKGQRHPPWRRVRSQVQSGFFRGSGVAREEDGQAREGVMVTRGRYSSRLLPHGQRAVFEGRARR
jgi:isoquinoline 1-oxidoreductase beta subunit